MNNEKWLKITICNLWKEFKNKIKKNDKSNNEKPIVPKGGFCPKCGFKLRVSFDHADSYTLTSLDCDNCGWYIK